MAPLRQEEYFEYDEVISKPAKLPKITEPNNKKSIAKKQKVKRKIVLGTIAFMTALTIVYRYAMINNMNMENITLKKELETLNNSNSQLQLLAEQSINLSYVEEYAKENLGLQKPQNYQIEYINVSKQDLIDNNVINENKNWFEEILFNIIEFFN